MMESGEVHNLIDRWNLNTEIVALVLLRKDRINQTITTNTWDIATKRKESL